MRYLRKQVLNRRAPYDTRMYMDATDGVVMANSNNITMPKSSNTIVSPVAGMIRYNSSTNEVQVYQGTGGGANGVAWRSLRYKESTNITQQSLGYGDAVTQYFGPLNPAPPTTYETGSTWTGANLLVVVENVIQLHTTNYTIATDPTIGGVTYTPKTSGITNIGATTIVIDPTAVGATVYPSVDIRGATVSGSASIAASTTLSTVTITGTGGTFSCASTTLAVNQAVVISGTYGGTGSINGYSNPTTYYIIATNGTTTFTLSKTPGGTAITTTAGTPSGLTYTIPACILSYTVNASGQLTQITISKATVSASIPAGTALTITDASNPVVGSYIYFSSAVPLGKPVTVLHGFDK